jgi:hypothetical protein
VTDEELLAEYRKQYEYAMLETHMLVDGILYQRCHICRKNPLIIFGCVLWCDACINEHLNEKPEETVTQFITRKRRET